MKKVISVFLIVCSLAFVLVGCGDGGSGSSSNPYAGKWHAYKISYEGMEMELDDMPVKMDVTIEFKSNGEYELINYVDGEESDTESGEYEVVGKKVELDGGDEEGEIVGGNLIVHTSDGDIYFKR